MPPVRSGRPIRHQDVAQAEVVLVHGGLEVRLGSVSDLRCDLYLVDRLARIQLAARRIGGSIVLRHPSTDLTELIALTGLGELLPDR